MRKVILGPGLLRPRLKEWRLPLGPNYQRALRRRPWETKSRRVDYGFSVPPSEILALQPEAGASLAERLRDHLLSNNPRPLALVQLLQSKLGLNASDATQAVFETVRV